MYFDIGLLAIIVLFALVGLAKGFFKPFNGLLATLGAFVIVYFTLNMVMDAILGVAAIKGVLDRIAIPLATLVAPEGLAGATVEQVPDVLSGGFNKYLSTPIVTAMIADPALTPELAYASIVTMTVINILVALLMFLVIRLVLVIVTLILNSLTRDKAKNGLNRLFGFFVGAIRGAVFCFTILIMATPFFGLIPAVALEDLDKNSVVCKPVTEFVFEQVATFMNPDKILGGTDSTNPNDDDDDDDGDDQAAQELAAAQDTLAAKIGSIKTEVAKYSNAEFLEDNKIYAIDVTIRRLYRGVFEYIKAGGEFETHLASLPSSTVSECNASIAKATAIHTKLISGSAISNAFNAFVAETSTVSGTYDNDVKTKLVTFLTKFSEELNAADATLGLPTDAFEWEYQEVAS